MSGAIQAVGNVASTAFHDITHPSVSNIANIFTLGGTDAIQRAIAPKTNQPGVIPPNPLTDPSTANAMAQAAAAQAGPQGAAATLFTGSQGVNPSSSSLSRYTLLGNA